MGKTDSVTKSDDKQYSAARTYLAELLLFYANVVKRNILNATVF